MPSSKEDVNLSDVYYKLGEIDGKLDSLVGTNYKVIYALIALAGATVGLKLMGSPPWLIISSFVNGFIFLFAAILALHRNHNLAGWPFILAFGFLGFVGNLHKILAPGAIEIRTGIFIITNLNLLFFLWKI